MTDMELAEEIELVIAAAPNAALGCMVATPTLRNIIAALRRGPERPPSGEMVMVLKEVNYRFEEWFRQIPQDSSWWTADDRRCEKTWNKVRAMLSAAEAEGRKS
jgi:hypothetical protein